MLNEQEIIENRAFKYLEIVEVMKNYMANTRDDKQALERILNVMLY